MKNTEIIAMNTLTISTHKFKDSRLTDATNKIASIYNDAAKYAETKNREIAKILGTVASEKSYEKDGFKSVADYAHEIFGIARNNAYALSTAGKVYNDAKAHPELKSMTPSKIAEVSSLPEKELKEALDSGKIKANSTQKELRDFATTVKSKTTKGDVLDLYTAIPHITAIRDKDMEEFSKGRIINDWDDFFINYISTLFNVECDVEVINLPKGKLTPDSKKANITRKLYLTSNYSLVVEFRKYNPVKKIDTIKPKYTKEQLLKMIAALEKDQNEVLDETDENTLQNWDKAIVKQ